MVGFSLKMLRKWTLNTKKYHPRRPCWALRSLHPGESVKMRERAPGPGTLKPAPALGRQAVLGSRPHSETDIYQIKQSLFPKRETCAEKNNLSVTGRLLWVRPASSFQEDGADGTGLARSPGTRSPGETPGTETAHGVLRKPPPLPAPDPPDSALTVYGFLCNC